MISMLTSQYILILFWVGLFAFVCNFGVMTYRTESVLGIEVRRLRPFFGLLVLIPLIYIVTNRAHFGDTETYRKTFNAVSSSLSTIPYYMRNIEKDVGFTVFECIFKSLISSKDKVFFACVASMQAFCLYKTYRKYSTNYFMSILLFIISADYASWMMNCMRQFIVVSLLFACTPLIVKKKYIWLILITIGLAQIHGSAYIMIPMYFIVQGKPLNKWTILFIVSMLVLVGTVDTFSNTLNDLLQNTQYDDIMTNEIWASDNGTNFIRVLVYSIPTLLAVLGYKYIRKADDKLINICVNMSVISVGFYLLSIFMSGIYIGRLPIYFSLYNYILLPWEIEHIFNKSSAKVVYLIMIVFYFVYYYVQMHMIWGLF